MGGKDVSFELLTYLDNEGAPPKAIEYILQAKEKAKTSKYWANWYRVYGLGQVGSLEGVIFENWEMIDAIPKEASLLCYGLDFGFNDPTAVIAMWRYNNEYYFDEVLYRSKILNGELAEVLKRYPRANIYADSAEPKSIKQLNQDGLRVYKTIKGKDSINYGIRSLQDVNFKVTKRSLNLIKELRNYIWATDRAGESTGKPIDNYNHAIDAMRYAFTMVARRKRNITKIRV
jgi:phage terminase large subunit